MARDVGKETLLERLFPAWPIKSFSVRANAWWLVILFCLAVWIVILIAWLR